MACAVQAEIWSARNTRGGYGVVFVALGRLCLENADRGLAAATGTSDSLAEYAFIDLKWRRAGVGEIRLDARQSRSISFHVARGWVTRRFVSGRTVDRVASNP